MTEAPYNMPLLGEWESTLAIATADELAKCMEWAHGKIRYMSEAEPGGTVSDEWKYWTSLYLMAKHEYERRGTE